MGQVLSGVETMLSFCHITLPSPSAIQVSSRAFEISYLKESAENLPSHVGGKLKSPRILLLVKGSCLAREFPVPVTVNNRHVHLSNEDAKKLFGETHKFVKHSSPDKHLWPGHILWEEKVTISGPSGRSISEVSLLGPPGNKSTIEMSTTDAYRLGLATHEIKSKKFSPGVTIAGPKGEIFLAIERPVNGRWLLVDKSRSEKMGLKDGMLVDVRVGADSDYATTFHKVQVIIEGEDRWAVYLDPDAASAASAKPGDTAVVLLD
jgi:putative phosphotransacetylase